MQDATQVRAREIFEAVFDESSNFMTPDAVSFHMAGPYAVELSQGTGLLDPTSLLFGVTVLLADGSRTTLGACFDAQADAVAYIDALA